MISGFLAYGASIWGSIYLGVALGAFVGAFVLGLYSNIFSRLMNLPSSIVKISELRNNILNEIEKDRLD